jgi:hypothetical protein
MKKFCLKMFIVATSILPYSAFASDPCRFAQEESLRWLEDLVDVEIDAYTPSNFVNFVFSKPKAEYSDDSALLIATSQGRRQKNGMACKMKRNSSVAKLLPVDTDPPQNNCIALNRAYLNSRQIDASSVIFRVNSKESGPGWVNTQIDYSVLNERPSISIPVLLTETSEDGPDGTFDGMHYCKIADPDKVIELINSLPEEGY